MKQSQRPKVLIVGAGFAGLFAVKAMSRTAADITLIDRQNHHVFQPLLYQVATAGLAPSDIAWPIRSILTQQRNVSVLLGEVHNIDTDKQQVQFENEHISYDYLVCATGAQHSYFGHDDWAEHSLGLKNINDATTIRRRLLLAFEKAETCQDLEERERLLRFVIVGAGPTGVELAGAIAELAHFTLAKDFRRIDPRSANILLVEAGPRVLPAFSETASLYAKRALQKLNVQVRLNAPVTDSDKQGVTIDGQKVPTATTIWAAGVAASPIGDWLNTAMDRSGRVIVQPDLSIEQAANVFVIGDTAAVKDAQGIAVPGIAPAAKQQGRYVARVISSAINNSRKPPPFHYRHAGNLATIGRKSAIVELPFIRLQGLIAWWVWGIAHIYFLIGLPSPLLVSFRWLWEYITYGRGARLITGKKSNKDP